MSQSLHYFVQFDKQMSHAEAEDMSGVSATQQISPEEQIGRVSETCKLALSKCALKPVKLKSVGCVCWPQDRPERGSKDGVMGATAPWSILMRGGGRGRTARREYVFCCSPACRINSWHEHNVSPLWFPALCGKQWNSQGPATSPLKAALCSDLSQTPCDLTSPICLGIRYVIWGTRHYMWSHGEEEEGLPPLHWDSRDGFSKVKSIIKLENLDGLLDG